MSDEINPKESAGCPLPINSHDTVQLGHGGGGKMTDILVRDLFVWAFSNPALNKRDDSAIVEIDGLSLSFSTDSFVVDPVFFPGGDIGELAVNGTVNDICMSGATPLFISAGFIIEEGFSLDDLKRIVISMKNAATAAGVKIVTGDTKVVNKGKGDKVFINTAGIGIIKHGVIVSPDCINSGDMMIINGGIAEHGIAVLSKREGLSFETSLKSDTVALNGLVNKIINTGGDSVHAMRDPTRGGLAAVLNELAERSNLGIRLKEDRIPIHAAVRSACELLGLDPLYVANEGKLIAVVERDKAESVLRAMKSHPLGRKSEIIGEFVEDNSGVVSLRTEIGGWRIVDMPTSEQLPRIC